MFCENCGKQIVEDSQFCEFCGAKQGAMKNVSLSSVSASASGKAQGIEKWLTQKNLFGLAAILIAVSLFYYFLIRPIQEKRAYEDCFKALNESGQIPVGMQTSEKNFRIDTCVKSRNADEIKMNYERENATKEAERVAKSAEEKRKAEQEMARREAVKLTPHEYANVKILNVNLITDYYWRIGNQEKIDITGNIKNENYFNIKNLVFHFDVTTDKQGKNKVGETDCSFNDSSRDFVVFANTTKKFSISCYFEKGGVWYYHTLKSVEKSL